MTLTNHFKVCLPEESNMGKKICYCIGTVIPKLLPILPKHRYPECQKRINSLIELSEKNELIYIKAFLIGMTNSYIADAFSFAVISTDQIAKKEYLSRYSIEIGKLSGDDMQNDMCKIVDNYINVLDLSGSVEKLFESYSIMVASKQDVLRAIINDYYFVKRLTEKLYISICGF